MFEEIASQMDGMEKVLRRVEREIAFKRAMKMSVCLSCAAVVVSLGYLKIYHPESFPAVAR